MSIRQSLAATSIAVTLLMRGPSIRAQVVPFPNARTEAMTGWTGPEFKLRQDYPTTVPPAERYPWKAFAPKTQPLEYIKAALAYALEGNVAVDWQVERNTTRNWYHVPWMHTTNAGREFVHGLTRERTTRSHQLGPQQTSPFQTWAVGMYNLAGGYVIGQVWADHDAPDASKAKFPDGAMSVKLLFSTATDAEVPYMHDAFSWQAHITPDPNKSARSIQTVRLVQIDVAIRDTRLDTTTGWMFGTFAYDGNAAGATPWDRMVPVGAMWGNDPTLTKTTFASGRRVKQSVINTTIQTPQHLGYLGRLNGPLDNKASSCLSCHSTAETPPGDAVPTARRPVMDWFRNIKAAKPFDTGRTSLDYSLQLALSIERFNDDHRPARTHR